MIKCFNDGIASMYLFTIHEDSLADLKTGAIICDKYGHKVDQERIL